MKRERQWDMFDVAVGACPLDDYLHQRYSENDLQSKFWVEPNDQVDELRPPPKGSKEQVIIPVQGPAVGPPKTPESVSSEPLPTRPPWEAAPADPLPSRPPWEAAHDAAQAPSQAPAHAPVQASTAYPPAAPQAPAPSPVAAAGSSAPAWSPAPPSPPAPTAPEAPAAAKPLSMEELLAQFHQAAKAYEERAKDELPTDQTEH